MSFFSPKNKNSYIPINKENLKVRQEKKVWPQKYITIAIHNIDGVSPSNGWVLGLAPYLLCVEMWNYVREENSTPVENS